MASVRRQLQLAPRPQGNHLVSQALTGRLPEPPAIEVGLAHFFLWQGIYLCEFRWPAPGRRLVLTLTGDHR